MDRRIVCPAVNIVNRGQTNQKSRKRKSMPKDPQDSQDKPDSPKPPQRSEGKSSFSPSNASLPAASWPGKPLEPRKRQYLIATRQTPGVQPLALDMLEQTLR